MVNYEIYSLGGNDTAIITAELPREDCIAAADRIMEKNADVEQVAMILNVTKNICTFKMAGGEFCGNACRAAAEYMRKNYGFEKCLIIINGIKIKGKSDGQTSEVIIPKSDLIKKIESDRLYCVFMEGITCVVKPQAQGEDNKKTAERIKADFEKQNKIKQALGVIFTKEGRIDPFVWVKEANTFFNETACLSGSIAAALYLERGKLGKKVIVQPSEEPYSVTIGKINIKACGKVSFIRKGCL